MGYSDEIRTKIAKQQYKNLKHNQKVTVNGHFIGIVRRVITDDTGLKVYVIEDPKTGHVTVLYRGSEGPGKPGSKAAGKFSQFIKILV